VSSKRDEYFTKLLVFGAGFLPTMDDVLGLHSSGLIPPETSHTRTMVPFKIDRGESAHLEEQANFLLQADGIGCSLDKGDYDLKVVRDGTNAFVLAWIVKGPVAGSRRKGTGAATSKKWWQFWN